MLHKKYFSLVELLVVIAVLTMLSALLMPSLNKAKESALRLNCKNSTRTVAQAWSLYVQDHDFNLFLYSTHSRKLWTAHFLGYLEDPGMLICPSTSAPTNIPNNRYLMGNAKTAWVENRNGYRPIKDWNLSSYTYNINLCPGNPYNRTASYRFSTAIERTAETPLLGDGWWRAPSRMNNSSTRYIPQNLEDPVTGLRGGNSADRFITNRHGDMTVLSYVDGHSESVFLADVFAQYWYQGYDTNQPVLNF